MPARNSQRDTAKAEYIKRRRAGEKINLKEFADRVGVPYGTVRNWKRIDQWDESLERKRGGQTGNRNSKGKKNAKGNHGGAPRENKNAEKDGAYSAVFFDKLSDEEKKWLDNLPTGAKENTLLELRVLRYRQKKILAALEKYSECADDDLYIATLTDMRRPGKSEGGKRTDGAEQKMGLYNKDSAFTRREKLQEALYKVSGRIATLIGQLRQGEEFEKRYDLEVQRLDIAKIRATGVADMDGPDAEGVDADETLHGKGDGELP